MSRRVTADDLRSMTPEDIVEAQDAGRLDHLLAGGTPDPEPDADPGPGDAGQGARGEDPGVRLRPGDLSHLSPEKVAELHRIGALDHLM